MGESISYGNHQRYDHYLHLHKFPVQTRVICQSYTTLIKALQGQPIWRLSPRPSFPAPSLPLLFAFHHLLVAILRCSYTQLLSFLIKVVMLSQGRLCCFPTWNDCPSSPSTLLPSPIQLSRLDQVLYLGRWS